MKVCLKYKGTPIQSCRSIDQATILHDILLAYNFREYGSHCEIYLAYREALHIVMKKTMVVADIFQVRPRPLGIVNWLLVVCRKCSYPSEL